MGPGLFYFERVATSAIGHPELNKPELKHLIEHYEEIRCLKMI